MEQPPTPSSSGSEPDVTKPPIWDRPAVETLPIDIPNNSDPVATPLADPPTSPIVPECPFDVPTVSGPPAAPPWPSAPSATQVPDQAWQQTGSTFSGRSFMTTPASGTSVSGKPRWPTEPPTVGRPFSPAPPEPTRSKGRTGLIALAVFLAAAVAIGGFFFGRSVASSESATTPVISPTSETPTTVPEATAPPATAAPTPTATQPLPRINDAPSPLLPGEVADEPVAAVAAAVAPAVVLIQNDLGQGSGIIYDEAGLILTNAHVVGDFTQVQVTLASGVKVPGQVLGGDPLTDVAVVSIDTDFEFGVAALAPENSVEVGQLAVAIGSPFGLEQTVTSGIVSAKGRVIENVTEDGRLSVVAMTQTDAPINPGNSGGALADRQGRVIGMNTSIRTDGSGGSIGVGFAVPAETAKLIADRIIAGQSLDQGFLGINGGTPVIGEPGVVVGEVTPGSGAETAGIVSGDLITGFNGGVIKNMSDLAAAVRLQPPNATVSVDLMRDGQRITVDVTLGLLTEQ